MSDETQSIDGEVVSYVGVIGEDQGVQLTAINLNGSSHTEQFTDDGEYYLVREDND